MKRIPFLVSLMLLSACTSQPSQTAQPQAQSLPIAQTPAKAAPVFVPPTLSAKPGPSGQISRQGDQVTIQIQLPPLPAFQTQALNFAGANQITATLMDSSGHTYTPVGAIDNQIAYPLNGELSLSFTGVRPDELLIAELQVQVNAADVPQAHLAAVLGAASTANASGEISFRTTPTALAVKAMQPANVSQARSLSLSALQAFVDTITGASGSGQTTTYSQIHPTLVNTALLATHLATTPMASLTALDYRNAGATANITVSGLVSTDRVRLQLTDAASAIVTSAGAGLVSLTKATPGTDLKLLASSVATPGTTYAYAPDSSSITLTEGQPTAISLVATPATPTLTSISPTTAGAGDTLTLTGTNFHRVADGNTVTIGGVAATVLTVVPAGTSMTVTVPTGVTAGTANVLAQVGSVSSSAQPLTVLSSFAITNLSANSGKSGDSITLTGAGFTGATEVLFNGRAAASITPVSNTQITAVVPYGAVTTGQISIVTPNGSTQSSGNFTISQRIWLVNASATGDNSGTHWTQAYTDLQTALQHTSLASGDEIWVAKGKYTPVTPSAGANRSQTFQLKAGVKVYGSFAGGETALPGVRDFVTNLTELSGDIDTLADVYDTDITGKIVHTGIAGNAYHVVTGANTATLDGFMIRGGNANGSGLDGVGGGMNNESSSPTLSHLTISGNSSTGNGGGLHNSSSNPTLTHVTISGNSSTGNGGGLRNSSSNPTLTHVNISGNSAEYGGGLSNEYSSPTLSTVTLSGNSATNTGGGLHNIFSSDSELTHVTVSGNSAAYGGGLFNQDSNPTLTHVIVSGNSATGNGGGLFNPSGNPKLAHVTFNANTAPSGGGFDNAGGTPVLVNVLFWNSPLRGVSLSGGQGNVIATSDPFVNSAQPDGLQLTSTATEVIDQGINQAQVNAIPLSITLPLLDVLGAARPQGLNHDPGAYEFVPPAPPSITSLSVSSGKSGDSITLTGTGFTGATEVLFNGRAAANITPVNNTQITAVVPYGAVTTGQISIVTPNGSGQSSGNFTISQRIWLVNASATGDNSGTHWTQAYTDLQTALQHASLASGDEIWVAKGKYTPVTPSAGADRSQTFQLKAGVKVYGSFAGGETALPGVRNFVTNLTELSGDIDTDADVYDTDISGGIMHTGINGNSYRVVTGASTATLDGFTIRGGNANVNGTYDNGAGLYNTGSSPTLSHLIISGNTAAYGGGMSNLSNSHPTLRQVAISGNTAVFGGGLFNENSSPTLSNVTISRNAASSTGGGLCNFNSNPTLAHVTFNANSVYNSGGTPVLVNVLFRNSLLEGLTLTPGQGNVVVLGDPFVNSAQPDGGDGIWFNGNDGLQLTSTATEVIDQGINQAQVNAIPLSITLPLLDVLGVARPQGLNHDPGAYEASGVAD